MPRRAAVVAVANHKGGVAKTTTVACLGAAWAAAGHRVLLVDLDPQACLTFSLPLQCETLSHRGVGQLQDTVYDVQQATNPRLAALGVLPTLFDGRSAHARLVLDRIGADYGVPVVGPPIPRSVRFAEAPAAGRTLVGAGRSTKGAQAYRAVAADLADRLRRA